MWIHIFENSCSLFIFLNILYFSGPVKDVNIEEKNPSASMEIQNGTTMSHNDLVLNASVIVGREKRSARSRSKNTFIGSKFNIYYINVYLGKYTWCN